MPKRRNPPARYQLPLVVNPTSHKCFVIQVPNDIYHIAAFRGQMKALASAYAWGNDDAHTAKDVAAVWQTVIENMESCMPALQFRQPNNCTLEVSFDGGISWSPIFNAYNCALGAIADEIANGTLSQNTTQQSPSGVLPAATCEHFHVKLNARDRWHSPVPVSEGYTITISNVVGGWSDGYALGSYWQCPDGEYYSLGYCTGSYISGYAGDPIPSTYHMRLIGHVTTWFDAYNTTYTVPDGTAPTDFVLQANDSDLSDNLGSIEFDVEICNNAWVHTFDFSTGDHGWYAFNGWGSLTGGVWSGIDRVVDGISIRSLYILLNLPGTSLRSVAVTLTNGNVYLNTNDLIRGKDDVDWTGSQLFSINGSLGDHANVTNNVQSGLVTSNGIKSLLVAIVAYGGNANTISSITVSGVGAEPTWS